jgi:hypothetical protein
MGLLHGALLGFWCWILDRADAVAVIGGAARRATRGHCGMRTPRPGIYYYYFSSTRCVYEVVVLQHGNWLALCDLARSCGYSRRRGVARSLAVHSRGARTFSVPGVFATFSSLLSLLFSDVLLVTGRQMRVAMDQAAGSRVNWTTRTG